jgi:hypothetical protein
MNARVETDPTAATVHTYERLRGSYLETRLYLAGELGLNVLLRQGMLAWIRTCPPARGSPSPPPGPVDRTRVPAPLHEDIIDVMVTMTTSLSRSVHGGALPA